MNVNVGTAFIISPSSCETLPFTWLPAWSFPHPPPPSALYYQLPLSIEFFCVHNPVRKPSKPAVASVQDKFESSWNTNYNDFVLLFESYQANDKSATN
jgi:hypothetical protein